MSYYLKKNWKLIFWPCFLGLMAQSAYVIIQLMMMQSFQAAFELDLSGFIQWTSACIGGYIAYFGLAAIAGALEANAKRKLNNQVRHDLYLTLLQKNIQNITVRITVYTFPGYLQTSNKLTV